MDEGWPPGPTYALRAAGDKAARRTGGAIASALALVTSLVLNENNVGTGDSKPEEPENEVSDFPVMWAGPGTLARLRVPRLCGLPHLSHQQPLIRGQITSVRGSKARRRRGEGAGAWAPERWTDPEGCRVIGAGVGWCRRYGRKI